MEEQTLFVISLRIRDASRRARVRRALRYFGSAVSPDLWEVSSTTSALAKLQQTLSPDLAPEDEVRIYPVCGRCRSRVRFFGSLADWEAPAAIVV